MERNRLSRLSHKKPIGIFYLQTSGKYPESITLSKTVNCLVTDFRRVSLAPLNTVVILSPDAEIFHCKLQELALGRPLMSEIDQASNPVNVLRVVIMFSVLRATLHNLRFWSALLTNIEYTSAEILDHELN